MASNSLFGFAFKPQEGKRSCSPMIGGWDKFPVLGRYLAANIGIFRGLSWQKGR